MIVWLILGSLAYSSKTRTTIMQPTVGSSKCAGAGFAHQFTSEGVRHLMNPLRPKLGLLAVFCDCSGKFLPQRALGFAHSLRIRVLRILELLIEWLPNQ